MYLPFLTCMLVTVATESIFYLILGPQNWNFILICVLTNTIYKSHTESAAMHSGPGCGT